MMMVQADPADTAAPADDTAALEPRPFDADETNPMDGPAEPPPVASPDDYGVHQAVTSDHFGDQRPQGGGRNMTKTLCIYHANCADGFGAAWAVRHGLGEPNVEFHPGIHQTPPPDVTGRKVVMVDFSYKRPVLEEMGETAQSILILDHHKSAAEDLAEYPEPPGDLPDQYGWLPDAGIYAKFDMDRSGATMAWDHFCGGARPRLIAHIEDHDLWRFKMEGTREIQANVFSFPYNFAVWDNLMAAPASDLIEQGRAIERKHFKDIDELLGVCQRRLTIGGHDVPVASLPHTLTSDAGHKMAQGEPFAACYWDTEDARIFSLRSTDDGLDVSEIATAYGGGGHRAAAGFSVPREHELARA